MNRIESEGDSRRRAVMLIARFLRFREVLEVPFASAFDFFDFCSKYGTIVK